MAPHVVFLPGASGAAGFWTPVADRMPDGWSTQLLSWPGAGVEPHDSAITGYHDLVERAAAAVGDGSDVVAQSMGGVVAIGLALAYPRRIRRLVLVATSGGIDLGPFSLEDWRADYLADFPGAASWVTQQHVDHTGQLPGIEIPPCLIWGERDSISPPAVGRALESVLPHSSLHIIPRGTHAMAHERPNEVADLIIGHLN